jgi:hypothetical protein
MRKIMGLSIAVTFALMLVGGWAVATTSPQDDGAFHGTRISPIELMSDAPALEVQVYELS